MTVDNIIDFEPLGIPWQMRLEGCSQALPEGETGKVFCHGESESVKEKARLEKCSIMAKVKV